MEALLCSPLSRPSPAPPTAPSEPLLCKFADGGQKKRQTQVKYPQNGRAWTREGEVSHKRVISHKEVKNKKRNNAVWPLPFFFSEIATFLKPVDFIFFLFHRRWWPNILEHVVFFRVWIFDSAASLVEFPAVKQNGTEEELRWRHSLASPSVFFGPRLSKTCHPCPHLYRVITSSHFQASQRSATVGEAASGVKAALYKGR